MNKLLVIENVNKVIKKVYYYTIAIILNVINYRMLIIKNKK